MTARFGIDTSILVRLATGDPEDGFEHCVRKLTALIERADAEVFASNQVLGEAYVALQHHYGVSKPDARAALASVLKKVGRGLPRSDASSKMPPDQFCGIPQPLTERPTGL